MDPLRDEGVPVPAISSVGGARSGPRASMIRTAQQQTNWCWAAATQMLRRCLALAERAQCAIAGQRLGKPCCEQPGDCNIKLQLGQISQLLAENEIRSTHAPSQLPEEQFWAELHRRQPLLLADIFQNGHDGHVRVVFGWEATKQGKQLVRVADPANDKIASTTHDALRQGRWRETWHSIEVAHGA